jgi:hypothetical protein
MSHELPSLQNQDPENQAQIVVADSGSESVLLKSDPAAHSELAYVSRDKRDGSRLSLVTRQAEGQAPHTVVRKEKFGPDGELRTLRRESAQTDIARSAIRFATQRAEEINKKAA